MSDETKQVFVCHPTLGPLTAAEYLLMRQVPIGYAKAEWTQERLDIIRKTLANNPHLANISPDLLEDLRRQFSSAQGVHRTSRGSPRIHAFWRWWCRSPYRVAAMILFVVIPPIAKWLEWLMLLVSTK